MASRWYPLGLQSILARDANSDLVAGTVKLVLLTSAYAYNAADQFYSDLSGAIGSQANHPVLGSKDFTGGIFDAVVPDYDGADLDTNTATQAVVYIDTGSPSTSRLLLHLGNASVFPLTGSGPDQPIVWTPVPLCATTYVASPANAIWYPLFAQAIFERPADSDLVTENVYCVAVDMDDYTYSAAHDFLDDVPAGARVGTPQLIGNKTFANGVFDSSDGGITFPAFAGDQSEGLLIYIDDGVAEASSRLVGLLRNAQGLPVTPNGEDQPVTWGADGILKLGASAA